jgi:O-antigen/teichoic acid export membrane protein
VFIGEQRNHISAVVTVFGRVVSAFLIAIAVLRNMGLVYMAAGLCLANFLVSFSLIAAWRRYASGVEISYSSVRVSAVRELLRYCYGLTIWTVSGLLISGLDTVIVGSLDFRSVAYYGVAVTITTFLIQFQGAVTRALVPAATVLHARQDLRSTERLLGESTRYGTLLLLWIGVPLIIFAEPILRVWLGAEFAVRTSALLRILVAANIVRLLCLPYSTIAMGMNLQNRIAVVGLAEGVINIIFSILLGRRVGAIGVASGTLIGAVASVLMHFWYSMPRTRSLVSQRAVLFFRGIFVPAAAFLPWLVMLYATHTFVVSPYRSAIANVCGVACAGLATWNLVVFRKDRLRLMRWLGILPRRASRVY